MAGEWRASRRHVRETVQELRAKLGLFSFRVAEATAESAVAGGTWPQLGVRRGGIAELLVAGEGAGAVTLAWFVLAQSAGGGGVQVLVDAAREWYVPALTGWGIDPGKLLVLRPGTLQETCWSIEQCLRCPGVSATWAWVNRRVAQRVHRRWQMAAEAGGGIGVFFRPVQARRDPVWADSRLLVTPRPGREGEARRVDIEVLYRRGGKGGDTQAWEIDHAEGLVRLAAEVANPTAANRSARA